MMSLCVGWHGYQMDLEHYFGRENQLVKVRLDNAASMQFLSAGQKSRVIARLARSRGEWTGWFVRESMESMCQRLSISEISVLFHVCSEQGDIKERRNL